MDFCRDPTKEVRLWWVKVDPEGFRSSGLGPFIAPRRVYLGFEGFRILGFWGFRVLGFRV